MSPHRYNLGQRVRFLPSGFERKTGSGIYEVIALLPEERGDWQYRLRSVEDSHQRVVREHQIDRVAPALH